LPAQVEIAPDASIAAAFTGAAPTELADHESAHPICVL